MIKIKIKKKSLAIVNRTFLHDTPLGEGLLQLLELAASTGPGYLITQSKCNLKEQLAIEGRGKYINIRSCKAFTTPSSGLLKRIFEALFFSMWTFICLVLTRPTNVYVATDPPVVVPFIVAVYCRLFGASFVYHLQDIHPEAANIVVPVNKFLFSFLQAIDNFTIRNAKALITLSEDMMEYIRERSGASTRICIIDNPGFYVEPVSTDKRTGDIIFCGNAGRLQRIPLLIGVIDEYLLRGGVLNFTFAGGGCFAPEINLLAENFDQVTYLGVLPASQAAKLVNQHRWALLPIDDEVTKFAFPSKSSSYALSRTTIIAICGVDTSVSIWVNKNGLGIVCEPDHNTLVECLFDLEKDSYKSIFLKEKMLKRLSISEYSKSLLKVVFC